MAWVFLGLYAVISGHRVGIIQGHRGAYLEPIVIMKNRMEAKRENDTGTRVTKGLHGQIWWDRIFSKATQVL